MTKLLLRALAGETLERPPIWLMRQAGRYLPEYRAKRAEAGSFLDLCYNPDFAVEVTLQPIRRFGFDASILFSDILVVPHALGRQLDFVTGEGPRLDPLAPGDPLPVYDPERFHAVLRPVYDTVAGLRRDLPPETTLIGFAGAPWTVATYMVAGRGTPDQAPARRWAFTDPDGFQALIDLITDTTIAYLLRQVAAGAEVIQLFDTWAGALTPLNFDRFAIRPVARIVSALKAAHPDLPVIGFPKGAGAQYLRYKLETGVDALSIDTAVDPAWARDVLQPHGAVQGNLDPMTMVVGGAALEREATRILEALAPGPHIFNLGHGITPDADPANVDHLLKIVRGEARPHV